jgi:hypothetical protein
MLVFFALIALFVVPPQSALAVGGTVTDRASCETFGGIWEVTAVNTCKVTNIATTVHLDILGIIDNNGSIINNGQINHYGTINNNGIFTLNGTIFNVPQMYTKDGSVFNNNTGGIQCH